MAPEAEDEPGRRYESIGQGYAEARRADPRIAEQIAAAIGPDAPVLNVGAGTGNYEPTDRQVIAAEPSAVMLSQRAAKSAGGAPAAQAVAEALPFRDDSFAVTMATFTVHHWSDRAAGLRELARVAERQVCLVYDTAITMSMWLLDYFPEVASAPMEIEAPDAESIGEHLTVEEVRTLLVPPDCTDGFSGAYWNRPEHYLDPTVQASMSTFALLDPAIREEGTERLRHAIDSGQWDERYGHLRSADHYDMGYRLVLSRR